MASELIGLVMGITTRNIYGVVDPTSDHELDNPRLLQVQVEPQEPVTMVKVARAEYETLTSHDDVVTLAVAYYTRTAMANEPSQDPERIDLWPPAP